MAASDMRNRHHVQPLLTWSTNAAHPVSLETLQVKEGAGKSNFTCKLTAIWKPLDVCLNQPSLHQEEGILTYSDSRSALEAIQKGNTKITQNIHSLLTQLETLEKDCILQWIPAHVGIGGNEMADELAKEARKLSHGKEQITNTYPHILMPCNGCILAENWHRPMIEDIATVVIEITAALHTQDREHCCDRDVWRHLRLFIGHNNRKFTQNNTHALENATTLPNHLTLGFFLDNLSVVKSVLNSKTGNYLIDRALLLISRLNRNGNRCTIQWIKGHSGNVGNDIADSLAKRGAESADPSCYKLAPLSFVKSAIYGRAREAWESRFLSLAPSIHTRFGLTPMSLLDKRYSYIVPSEHIVVGLLSGHTWTDSFVHRIGVIDDPSCPYCDAEREETLSHIVLECSSLDALRFPLLPTCAEELGYTPRSLKTLFSTGALGEPAWSS
ncbi:hypothetical protein LAZ67_3002373 [Cordylochernes scorpioides]|uniref:ribonuclease H n=1 Tax=Cordylochernes scorpioides TaxID=51811 RepID=A0ABY6K817_9ARAC|nr:hypothetical protein LAZ67_3002373 [Cordylochernes scorpioides]